MPKLKGRILVVDDDADILMAARIVLKQKFEVIETESNPQRLSFLLNHNQYDVILLDMNYALGKTSGNEGIYWLRNILSLNPEQRVIVITAYGDIKLAVEAMKQGAADFIVKPWENEKLEATVQASFDYVQAKKELTQLKGKQADLNNLINTPESILIGESPVMKQVLKTIGKVAGTDANILILGENGTGKELVARYIHHQSHRKNHAFIKVDVGALSANLFESEMFGYKKGAFTDAKDDRVGRFELANGGTLFLDEIGNLPIAQQTKLLTVLQNREVIPLGNSKSVPLDIRLVSATNMNIHEAVAEQTFRQDLLYRINTVEITIPPLRSRGNDIALLARHFLKLYSDKYRRDKVIEDETIDYLKEYNWPGNIRELQHAIERAVIMSEGQEIRKQDFVLATRGNTLQPATLNLEQMEKAAIIAALAKYEGNLTHVAKELGLGRTTLYRKMTRYGLNKS